MCPSDPSCGCINHGVGHPVVFWRGWVTNQARNNGADIYGDDFPIVPLRQANWTAYQVQLRNGWELTNYGKRMSQDTYDRMLWSSASMDTKNHKQTSGKMVFEPAGARQVSAVELARMATANAPPQSQGVGGTGSIAPGVNLGGRTFFG